MGISIGLLELKSIPVGIETADEMVKAQAELVKVRRELDLARLQLEQLKNERE